jgi:hypothetical protein
MNATTAATEEADEIGTRWPVELSPVDIEHSVRRFPGDKTHLRNPPGPGELVLWRLRTEWQFVSAMDSGIWLTPNERKRLRTYRNSAVGKRFGVARTVLRMILAAMFACDPGDVRIEETPDERLQINNEIDGRAVHIDLAVTGIWIVIAASAQGVGVALAAPATNDEAPAPALIAEHARNASRARTTATFDTKPHTQTIDFPMPGEIVGAVTVAAPVTRLTAFGWTR